MACGASRLFIGLLVSQFKNVFANLLNYMYNIFLN
ncbi:hypothetical protein SSP1_149 [Shigella phage SSP1]|uniref:Uncharacterized protein n=1 Tax=Shigella phage SSP1 TaxID=1983588 RepID=A0A2N9QQR7_9CAUD|nr:hypothetical protein HOS34_gp033 [Shigella phage SSP1]ASD50320.1 hypothetical protein SSP1_149 [Shigella phage SSP1]UYL23113.1 hypothetical protein [Salmonella phage PS3-1]WNL62728.1 hypothetical protein [Escherichia phage Es2]